jgi:hypothetical protein
MNFIAEVFICVWLVKFAEQINLLINDVITIDVYEVDKEAEIIKEEIVP